jgi:hypothetical protein
VETKVNAQEAHVTIGDGEHKLHKVVAAGPTLVSALKAALGVDAASVLYLVKGKQRSVLSDDQTIDVESGMHFEAVTGGGVS